FLSEFPVNARRSNLPRNRKLSPILRRGLRRGCSGFTLQCGDQSIEDGFQILWALTEQAFHTVPMNSEFANLPGDASIDIRSHGPRLTSRCGLVVRGNPGKRVVETSSSHPVHDQFLNVSSATGAPDS